jgi:hypothetical protein
MLKIAIKDSTGKTIDRIDFPETLEETPLSRYASFEAAFNKRKDFLSGEEDINITSNEFALSYIDWAIAVLRAFLEVNPDDYPLGDWQAHIHKLAEGKEFDYEEIEGTVLSLLANVYKLVSTYQTPTNFEQDYQFEYKGQDWIVKGAYRDMVTKQMRFEGYTSAQVVEALRMNEAYKKQKKNDENGNFFFTSLLYTIACFAQQEDERFPDKQNEIDQHLNSRVAFFADIDTKTALDVSAFFFNISNLLEAVRMQSIFGTLRQRLERISTKYKHLQSDKQKTPV